MEKRLMNEEMKKILMDSQQKLQALKEKHDKGMEELSREANRVALEQKTQGAGFGEKPWSEVTLDEGEAPPSAKTGVKWYEIIWIIVSSLVEAFLHQEERKFPPIPETVRCGSFDVNLRAATELFRSQWKDNYGREFACLYVRTRKRHYIKVGFVYKDDERKCGWETNSVWKISEWDAKAAYVEAKDKGRLLADSWHPTTEI